MHITDDLELRVAEILKRKNIKFVHESEKESTSNLDFYLPDYDIFIEVKKFHADRVVKQLASQYNVILIQGRKSIEFLEKIL